jgi:hypothetical protein
MRRFGVLHASGLALVVSVAGAIAWLLTRPPTEECHQFPAGPDERTLGVRSIVVKPWYGPHHVYGVFLLPVGFAGRSIPATLRVGDFQKHVTLRSEESSRRALRTAQAPTHAASVREHSVKRIYVPTRTALRFLVTGRFGDLRTPCQWTLILDDLD